MELFKEVLVKILARDGILSSPQDLDIIAVEAIEGECCRALRQIKALVEDKSLSDFECIEEIVGVFESVGSACMFRHDW